ncbi:unnamed protein product, partial [Prorocentrum cordatum]
MPPAGATAWRPLRGWRRASGSTPSRWRRWRRVRRPWRRRLQRRSGGPRRPRGGRRQRKPRWCPAAAVRQRWRRAPAARTVRRPGRQLQARAGPARRRSPSTRQAQKRWLRRCGSGGWWTCRERSWSCALGRASQRGWRRSAGASAQPRSRLAEDLYGAECHFLYELLQNAEDAHRRAAAPGGAGGTLHLSLGSGAGDFPAYLLSDNDEEGLTPRDVEAMCDISASSKKGQQGRGEAVGHKGIGFKSVFAVSDCPYVLSRGFTFKFDVAGPLGKLGYITPTWVHQEELASLPLEARVAWQAGRTVVLLPLRRPALGAAIAREMEELWGPSRALALFLRGLRRIELSAGPGARRRLSARRAGAAACVVVEDLEGVASTEEHRYIIHEQAVPLLGAAGTPGEVVLAFPVPTQAQAACTTPPAEGGDVHTPRCVGFGFAVHCGHLDLVASRDDLHRGSRANVAVRDALPSAFEAACASHAEVAARALAFVGPPPLDPFWRPTREAILQQLQNVACVPTAVGARRPSEVLLPGAGPCRRAAALLPPELLLEACGRAAVCEEPDPTRARLLRRLGAADFAAEHLVRCLGHRGERWPAGWVAHVWAAGPAPAAAAVLSVVYDCLAAAFAGEPRPEPGDVVEEALRLPQLPIFPLMGGAACGCTSHGPIFASLCQ